MKLNLLKYTKQKNSPILHLNIFSHSFFSSVDRFHYILSLMPWMHLKQKEVGLQGFVLHSSVYYLFPFYVRHDDKGCHKKCNGIYNVVKWYVIPKLSKRISNCLQLLNWRSNSRLKLTNDITVSVPTNKSVCDRNGHRWILYIIQRIKMLK